MSSWNEELLRNAEMQAATNIGRIDQEYYRRQEEIMMLELLEEQEPANVFVIDGVDVEGNQILLIEKGKL